MAFGAAHGLDVQHVTTTWNEMETIKQACSRCIHTVTSEKSVDTRGTDVLSILRTPIAAYSAWANNII